ncbi:MAG TPA: polysaccharide biosynthesis protein [Epulopiscium sp.]|nr:polysaccharide biosynthesis protein [Candidatus Epulonipiscium sp.]
MSNQTQKFVKGALILSLAGFLAKILSAFFRVPLTALIGDEGIGYYGLAYPIYTLFSAVAIVGIPSTIAKLVAEKRVHGKDAEAHQIFTHAFKLMLIVGTVMSAIVMLGAPWLVKVLNWEEQAIYSLWGLGLSPVFVCIMGVYRGYFQGMQDMLPTAISQVLENAGRVFIGLALAVFFMPDVAKAAGGASFGAVAGGILGSLVLTGMYVRRRKGIMIEVNKSKKISAILPFKETAKTVLWIAIPISIGTAINSIIALIDSGLVVMRLRDYGISASVATGLYGQLAKGATFINFPFAFGLALIIGLVPSISEAMARNDQKELHDKIELGTRIALLISFPASIGLAVLANPIMALIYPTYPEGGTVLAVAAFSIAFAMLGQALTGILQGMGNVWAPIYAIIGATMVKAIGNYILVATSLGVIGAAIASIAGYGTYTLINYWFVRRDTGFKLNVMFVVIKPLIASLVMGGAAYGVSKILSGVLDMTSNRNNAIMTLGSVLVGVVVYAIVLVMSGGISKEDITHMRKRKI